MTPWTQSPAFRCSAASSPRCCRSWWCSGIVVFVHEYGHYIVARWCGIRSEVFSIGFGPVLWSRRDRRGTLWQVAALPLGGYVKFLGDSDGAEPRRPRSRWSGMSPAERARELPRRQRRAADADGARRAGVQLPADHRGLRRHRALAGRADRARRPSARSRRCRASSSRSRPGDVVLAVNGAAGRRASSDLYRVAAARCRRPGRCEFRVERGGETLELTAPYALPPLVQGVEPLSPASGAGLRRGDVILTADGRALASFEDLRAGRARLGRPHHPARGLARRRRRSRSSITPAGARHRRRRGRLRAAGDDRRRRRAALPARHRDAGALDRARLRRRAHVRR